jgi:hypothetical protein
MVRIDLSEAEVDTEYIAVYPEICNIGTINERFSLSRWPFIEGPNTQESAFMHYLLA